MPTPFPQPITTAYPRETLAKDFTLHNVTGLPDVRWDFQMAVSNKVEFIAAPPITPNTDGMTILARYSNQDPPYLIEVSGQLTEYEIDAGDFLDAWLEAQGTVSPIEVLSRIRIRNIAGHTSDIIARGDMDGFQWVGRLVCMKYGPRVVFISFRAGEEDYANLAEEFFVSLMSFRFIDETPGFFAETVRWVQGTIPVPWKTPVPASCQVMPKPGGAYYSEFRVNLIASTTQGSQSMGNLTVMYIDPTRVRDAQHAIETVLQAVRQAGIEFGPVEQIHEPEPAEKMEAYYLYAKANLPIGEGEVRVRIIHHPKLWICAAIVGPSRTLSHGVWMRNKRLLDVVTMTTELI